LQQYNQFLLQHETQVQTGATLLGHYSTNVPLGFFNGTWWNCPYVAGLVWPGEPSSPFFGDVTFTGGVSYSTTHMCPHIPFYIAGFAQVQAAFGVRCCGVSINLFAISLKIGAERALVTAASWRTRADRRRGYDWRRRRGVAWQHHSRAYSCQVQIDAKLEVTAAAVIKGWLKVSFGLSNHVLTMQIGLDSFGLTGWSSEWGQNLITTTLR